MTDEILSDLINHKILSFIQIKEVKSALKLQELVKEKVKDTRLVNTIFILQSLMEESEK
jgi:hypothetical protein